MRSLPANNGCGITLCLTTLDFQRVPPRPPGDRRPLLTWKERNTFDVFSSTGAYLGRVQLPAESILLAIRDNRLLPAARWSERRGADQRVSARDNRGTFHTIIVEVAGLRANAPPQSG